MFAPPGLDRVSSRQLDGETPCAQASSSRNRRRTLLRLAGVRFKVSANLGIPQYLKLRLSLSQSPKGKQNSREIGQLEAEGKRMLDIRYPGWAAEDLGIIPDAQTGNAGTYGAHRATQYTQPYAGRVAIIVYQD